VTGPVSIAVRDDGTGFHGEEVIQVTALDRRGQALEFDPGAGEELAGLGGVEHQRPDSQLRVVADLDHDGEV
jgi:hypothetical protein